LKKSDVLTSLSRSLSVRELLKEYPSLDRPALTRLFAEAAAAVGPGVVEQSFAGKGKKRPGLKVKLYTDGASRGNPGEAGIGVLIEDETGHILGKVARYLGRATNNQAEYAALVAGLAAASEMGADEVEVLADSELLVRQMNGVYRVKSPDLQERYLKAKALITRFSRARIEHIPREQNREADALANEAIDKRLA